jgi:hypothetical protein
MSSLSENDIEDNDLYNILLNFIAKAVNLSLHYSPLLSFEDILA